METILGKIDSKLIIQHGESTAPNRNVFIAGGPGSFKSAGYVVPNIILKQNTSIVVTDVKGELYEQTARIKEQQGYKVRVINFKNFLSSDRYNFMDYVTKDGEANSAAFCLMSSSNDAKKRDVWFKTSKDLLKSLILYVVHEFPPDKRNMANLLSFIQRNQASSNDPEEKESALDKRFLELDFEHPARKAYELGFKQSEERTRASILLSFVSDISSFIEEDIQEFTSESDFFLDEVGKEKTIVYVMLPVMSQEHSSLTALFFTQMFDQLYKLGDENHSKVPFPVDFILDEFPNLGILPNYEEFLATCRGYRISVTTIVQSLSQLNDKYGRDKAESILGNHATKICLGNVNTATAEYFQKEMGNTTVEFETSGSSSSSGKENKSTSSSKNVSYAGRSLMNIDEIMSMDRDTALLLTTGKHPIKMNKVKHFVLFPNLVDKFESKQNEYERKKDSNVKEYYQQLENEWKEKEEKKKARIQAEIEEEERQRAEQEKQKAEKTKKESDTEKVSNQVKNDDKDNQPKEDNTNKQQAFFDKLKNKNKQSS